MIKKLLLVGFVLLFCMGSVNSEDNLHDIYKHFRCLVCPNQSIADSESPVAQTLRAEIKGLYEEGASLEEIKAHLIERYGDYVAYSPPLNPKTYMLWFGPFIILGIGLILWMRR